MHELGLAEGILDIVRQYVTDAEAPRVHRVTVRIGDMAGVVADSLDFCFGAMVAGTPFAGAQLVIQRVLAMCRCELCGESVPADPPVAVCPRCGETAMRLESGAELQVTEVELADLPGGARETQGALRKTMVT